MHDAGRVFRPIHLWSSLADTPRQSIGAGFSRRSFATGLVESAAGARLDLPASAAGSQWGGATAVESGAGISRQAETRN